MGTEGNRPKCLDPQLESNPQMPKASSLGTCVAIHIRVESNLALLTRVESNLALLTVT